MTSNFEKTWTVDHPVADLSDLMMADRAFLSSALQEAACTAATVYLQSATLEDGRVELTASEISPAGDSLVITTAELPAPPPPLPARTVEPPLEKPEGF